MFIPKLNSKSVFKYPFDCGRKLSLADCFVKTKLYFFVCLATADSISISVLPTKGSCFIIKKKLKPRKQSLKQHKTVRRYSCK